MLKCWKQVPGAALAVFTTGLALTAIAAEPRQQAPAGAEAAVKANAQAAPAAVIVRDVKTGQLRVATAQEIQALAAEVDQLFDRKASAERPVKQSNGSTAYAVSGSFASWTVARRNADGKIETVCVDDAAPAKKFMGLTPDGVPSTPAKVEEK